MANDNATPEKQPTMTCECGDEAPTGFFGLLKCMFCRKKHRVTDDENEQYIHESDTLD